MILKGKNGDIKVTGDQCFAVITNKLLEKNYGTSAVFPIEDLSKWLKRLKIYSNEDGTIQFSEWPNNAG